MERVRSKTKRSMKRKTLTKTEKLDENREKQLKEDLSPREEKQNLWGKRNKYMGRKFIDLSYGRWLQNV